MLALMPQNHPARPLADLRRILWNGSFLSQVAASEKAGGVTAGHSIIAVSGTAPA
jgi:hypothetical protein